LNFIIQLLRVPAKTVRRLLFIVRRMISFYPAKRKTGY